MRFKDFEIETNWEGVNVFIRCVHFELFFGRIYFWFYSQMRYFLVQTSGKRYLKGALVMPRNQKIYIKNWKSEIIGLRDKYKYINFQTSNSNKFEFDCNINSIL